MPLLKRGGQPPLDCVVNDCTDPWRNAPTIVLHFRAQHDGIVCREP